MTILVTGGRGMLGRTLCRRFPDEEVVVFDLPEGDIADFPALLKVCESIRPSVVIHAAAMTAVDACETSRERAFEVNGRGSAHVAEAAVAVGARLVSISTDYVFDGALHRPYREDDVAEPATVYGQSKRAGEEAILRSCPDAAILRTGWLYGSGGPSFVHTMLRLAGDEQGEPVRVVNDQRGNPTSTDALATVIAQLLVRHESGIFHATCEGEASWYDLARTVFEITGSRRGLAPCSSAEFPRPAPRPANSRLENRALRRAGFDPMPHWRVALAAFLKSEPGVACRGDQ